MVVKHTLKKMISSILILGLCMGMFSVPCKTSEVLAATTDMSTTEETEVEYITRREFIRYLLYTLDLDIKKEKNPYLNAAYRAGILEESDTQNMDEAITRAEGAVLINRADEYLHGDTLEESYVQTILEKRISDINEIDKDKREAVAKVIGKGIIKGFFNGYGVPNRAFRGNEYMDVKTAKYYIKLVTNTSKRAKLSPDGQLIRTTNLPTNADKYEYILACYPNAFYERKFDFNYITYTSAPLIEGDRYIYPVNVRRDGLYKNWNTTYSMASQMDLYLYDWVDYVEQYMNLLFNVNYKTIGQEWKDAVTAVSTHTDQTEGFYDAYIRDVKERKVTVESRKIVAEPSTLYYSDYYYMRVYVEFKITATELTDNLNAYIYSEGGAIGRLKLGEWMTGYFDVLLGTTNAFWGDGAYTRPTDTFFVGW